jgi:hypothetical protein
VAAACGPRAWQRRVGRWSAGAALACRQGRGAPRRRLVDAGRARRLVGARGACSSAATIPRGGAASPGGCSRAWQLAACARGQAGRTAGWEWQRPGATFTHSVQHNAKKPTHAARPHMPTPYCALTSLASRALPCTSSTCMRAE